MSVPAVTLHTLFISICGTIRALGPFAVDANTLLFLTASGVRCRSAFLDSHLALFLAILVRFALLVHRQVEAVRATDALLFFIFCAMLAQPGDAVFARALFVSSTFGILGCVARLFLNPSLVVAVCVVAAMEKVQVETRLARYAFVHAVLGTGGARGPLATRALALLVLAAY